MVRIIENQETKPFGFSVIICCYNSAQLLPKTLTFVGAQEVTSEMPWEIIIVDNGSTDQTYKVALDFSERVSVPLRVVKEPRQGLSFARHKGLSEAQYEICGFLDDDNWAASDWIKVALEVMGAHPEVGACGGLNEAIYEVNPPVWFKKLEGNFAVGPQGDKRGYVSEKRLYLWGAGLIIRRSAWKSLVAKGFSAILPGRQGNRMSSGEDEELTLVLQIRGWKLWYEPCLKLKHYIPASRINLEVVCSMYLGFGSASAVHDIYRYLLRSGKKDELTNLLNSMCLKNVKGVFFSLLSLCKGLIVRRNIDARKINLSYSWGRTIKSMELRIKCAQLKTHIESLCNLNE